MFTASLTYPVLVTVPGCCAVIVVLVVVLRVLPSKLYGVACKPTQVSAALAIVKVPATHSFPFALLNVNVGVTLSYVVVIVLDTLF